jgi:ubiquinone/menaquinone biosynthesis C-methylase UbiE
MNISSPESPVVDLLADRMDYSLRRYYVDVFHAKQIAGLVKGSFVLDLAGNKIRKRGQFNVDNYDLNVLYTNLTTEKCPDVQSYAESLPFASHSFDVVICSELLEHVQYPPAVLQEVYRVLRKGGILLVCVPFIYQIHGDPYDFGRYTDYYWMNHLNKLGFQNIEIQKQGLFWSVLVDMLRGWFDELKRTGTLSFKKLSLRLLSRAKKMAVARDTQAETQANPFYSSFTTGFGIRAYK